MQKNFTISDLLTLSYLKGLSNNKIIQLCIKFNSLDEFLNSYEGAQYLPQLENSNLFDDQSSIKDKIDFQLDFIGKKQYDIISYFDPRYPELLKHIPDPPILLYTQGFENELNQDSLSIVGTRKCTHYGKMQTEKFAEFFAKNNVIITSGMAYGVDMTAHEYAMKSNGKTIAVLASGLDQISPSTSVKFASKIVDSGGILISTFRFGTKALPQFFLQRNRIISGISKATLITESAAKGGSLWTARFASDQNREVYAIPGNINSEKSKGTNLLIKKNLAIAALSPEEVFVEAGYGTLSLMDVMLKEPEFNTEDEKIVYNQISNDPIHIDRLISLCEIDASQMLVILLNLEFNNIIRQLPGNHYVRQ